MAFSASPRGTASSASSCSSPLIFSPVRASSLSSDSQFIKRGRSGSACLARFSFRASQPRSGTSSSSLLSVSPAASHSSSRLFCSLASSRLRLRTDSFSINCSCRPAASLSCFSLSPAISLSSSDISSLLVSSFPDTSRHRASSPPLSSGREIWASSCKHKFSLSFSLI